MSDEKKVPRRGGLGRGLAALIPTAPTEQPRVGDDAADIIFGPRKTNPSATATSVTAASKTNSTSNRDSIGRVDSGTKRHSDDKVAAAKVPPSESNVSRETVSMSVAEQAEVNKFGASYREAACELDRG